MVDPGRALSAKDRQLLDVDEEILVAAQVQRVRMGSSNLVDPLVILTGRRFVVVGKPRFFGSLSIAIEIPWSEWSKIEGWPLDGDMMRIRLVGYTAAGDVEVVAEPVMALEIESTSRDRYLRFR